MPYKKEVSGERAGLSRETGAVLVNEKPERLGNVTVACQRCKISRKTFYKGRRRFAEARGARQALLDRSHRQPHHPRGR